MYRKGQHQLHFPKHSTAHEKNQFLDPNYSPIPTLLVFSCTSNLTSFSSSSGYLGDNSLLVHPTAVLLQGDLSMHPLHNARDTAESQPKNEHLTIATSHMSGNPAFDHAKRQGQVQSIFAIQNSAWLAYLHLLIALCHLLPRQ